MSAALSLPPIISDRRKRLRIIFWVFLICTSCKVLLFPSYRSTDFDVHRHWKAVTRHLPVGEWYWDDQYVDTRHTLDYPPGFAWLEYAWTNNYVVSALLKHGWVDEDCFALLSDSRDGLLQPVTNSCIAFMRSTVIVGDMIFWVGAYAVAHVVESTFSWPTFLGLVLYPGLLWLDHVHFQYNALMIGVWLLSIAALLRANITDREHIASYSLLGAAFLYSLLSTMKHLYLMFAPWYTIYLLRRYCHNPGKGPSFVFSFPKFIILGSMTVTTLSIPLIPMTTLSVHPVKKMMQQLHLRLFPFGRGLVHDYWAGNLWAFYAAASRIVQLPEVTPKQTAILLLLCQSPSYWYCWKAAATRDNSLLLLSMSLCGAASFFVSYHVHEKAILNVLVPLTLWGVQKFDRFDFWWECTAWGTMGLVPLLYEPRELLLKGITFTCYLCAFYGYHKTHHQPVPFYTRYRKMMMYVPYRFHGFLLAAVWIMVDLIPIRAFGRFEFAPLALTSLFCAFGLTIAFIRLLYFIVTDKVIL
ncbi:alpha-1,3-glucosyltransferase [Fistulifera solaris]|uniref:Alpha-1,3-glucosyltransferase n=1 Tax=Fistulifera solaris TaxID=1519565 RepID=A0A1Z5JTF6_FISSO|nr:alpha-1,3-glucosyltransferase [Fistulifera solaris]|eukprot:GAX17068.1 alpha-1,3-glucosyltransferase [Fistulifera solaris]